MLTARVLLAPHISTLLVDQHRGHRTEMLEAYAAAARGFEAEQPTAIAVLSARWEAPGAFLADAARRHSTLTDYYGFGVEVRYDCHGAPALARAVVAAARVSGVRAATTARGVDSGVTVPLHFLAPRRLCPVVPLSLARGPAAEHRAWGAALRRAFDAWPGRVAFIVGGMLSHNVHAWNLKRDTPEAQAFDARVLEVLGAGAWDELARLQMRPHAKARPEANLMHLEVLRGVLGAELAGKVLCYEPGPGVGAALVEFLAGEPAPLPAAPQPVTSPGRKRDPALRLPVRVDRGPGPRRIERHGLRPGAKRRPRADFARGTRPTRPVTPRGARPDVRPGARPGVRPGPRPGARPGPRLRPGRKPGARPGSRPGPKPDRGRGRGPRSRPR